MSTRTRILLASLVAAVLPLLLLAAGARMTVRERFVSQYEAAADAAAADLRARVARIGDDQAARLTAVTADLARDPRLSAALAGAAERNALIDFAPAAMAPAGFDFLVLIGAEGQVLSSGHYRNAYGRQADALLQLQAGDSVGIVRARRPTDSFTALARARTITEQGRRYLLVAGTQIDSALLHGLTPGHAAPLHVQLRLPDAMPASDPESVSGQYSFTMPFIDVDENMISADGATWAIAYASEPLDALLASIDRWFLAALGAALLLAVVIAQLLAVRVNRPLEDLARKASRVGLERYDVRLTTRRRDEVGSLSRVLDGMIQRLRASAIELRDAERRATVGDMARQVNHDIRNGLLPIRNVIGHLGEVAAESPGELATVFTERAGTLRGGIAYLESLATNYARLSPRLERQKCSINEIVTTVARDAADDGRISTDLAGNDPHVDADPVALRRILENLVVNALESLPQDRGGVTMKTARRGDAVFVEVSDTGAGMPADVVEHIFEDFYTTKARGTGLGLSIVRRLVADMGGRVAVASEPDRGTTFTLELPAA